MFPSLWSRRTPGKWATHRDQGRRPRLRLHLEPLEDRCLLASYTPGPLVLISNPDPLAGCPPGFLGANVSAEPYVAVNPANPKNLATIWIDHGFAGNAVAVTLDGGATWQNESLPGITQCTGGSNPNAADPWLSFAPNGDLHAVGEAGAFGTTPPVPELQLVNKSMNGGLTWSNPIQLNTTGNPARANDKPSITADPTNPNLVYATWARFTKGSGSVNNSETMFVRSTDGGQTWQPEQSIHQAPGTDSNEGHQVVVLPDGTLIDAFSEGEFTNNHQFTLTLLRSSDHGQTWSAPITAAVEEPVADPNLHPPNALLTDPDTGQLVEAHPFPSLAVDRSSGTLYAAWLDARFSNFQHNGIAFAMSTDGGFTWSNPIQVNQTPANLPSADQQAWSPAVAVAADGTVAVSYYDFRNNTPAAGALTDYWMAFCHPSATTPATDAGNWGEVRLTDTSFNLEQAPTRLYGAFFVGDYEGLAAVGKDFVAAWGMPDGTSTAQESIFFRRLQAAPGQRAASAGASAALPNRTVSAADLGGALLGLAFGTSRGLDTNAAAWDRFVGPGEQHRLAVLPGLRQARGHRLGQNHAAEGAIGRFLPAGNWRMLPVNSHANELAALELLYIEEPGTLGVDGSGNNLRLTPSQPSRA
jgi:hypothetical protein